MRADECLIKGLLKHDKKALEELYDRYHLLLWKIVSEAESDHCICEKLVTQVFQQLWTKPYEFKSEKRLALLLVKCCRAKMKEYPWRRTDCQNTIMEKYAADDFRSFFIWFSGQ